MWQRTTPSPFSSGALWFFTCSLYLCEHNCLHYSGHRPWLLVIIALYTRVFKGTEPNIDLLPAGLSLADSCTGILGKQPSLRQKADLFHWFMLQHPRARQRHNLWVICVSQHRTRARSHRELPEHYNYLHALLDKGSLGYFHDHKPEKGHEQFK